MARARVRRSLPAPATDVSSCFTNSTALVALLRWVIQSRNWLGDGAVVEFLGGRARVDAAARAAMYAVLDEDENPVSFFARRSDACGASDSKFAVALVPFQWDNGASSTDCDEFERESVVSVGDMSSLRSSPPKEVEDDLVSMPGSVGDSPCSEVESVCGGGEASRAPLTASVSSVSFSTMRTGSARTSRGPVAALSTKWTPAVPKPAPARPPRGRATVL